jgi:N-acetylmuramoyl-L-alanine amidase
MSTRARWLFVTILVLVCSAPVFSKTVCIDPGHQEVANDGLEPLGPGSSTMKSKVSAGTSGVTAGMEYAVVLAVGLRLRDLLEDDGTSVVMTRTINAVDISNRERALMANACHADLFIRLHCNSGSGPGGTGGCFALNPVNITGWTDDVYAESLRAAQIIQPIFAHDTGRIDLGLTPRSDMTGFNWSDVPVVLPEMLHMGNAAEDALVATPAFRQTMAAALERGILQYLNSTSRVEDWNLY